MALTRIKGMSISYSFTKVIYSLFPLVFLILTGCVTSVDSTEPDEEIETPAPAQTVAPTETLEATVTLRPTPTSTPPL